MARFMGTETEYGISTPTNPELSPIVTSTHAVVGYAAVHTNARSRWDYQSESPLKDSRGFDLRRYHTVPIVDPDAVGVANVVLKNGARYYVDHAHPEYSSPECSNAYDAMVYDCAGDVILNQAAQSLEDFTRAEVSVLKNTEPCPPLKFYKNNVDGKGASYGSHENYLYRRSTDFEQMAQALIPFFVTRQIICGAGRVGLGEHGEEAGFQISQRADYIQQEISLETTLNRGIINTRDEPHADHDKWGRLHVIIGDANMAQVSILLKLGMTKLVLDAIEAKADFRDLRLSHPVRDVQVVSRDLTLSTPLELVDGRRLTAIEILREYRERVQRSVDKLDDRDEQVLQYWGIVLDILQRDPLDAAHLLDWAAKWKLISSYHQRGVPLSDAKMKLIDLQYSDIDPAKSLYHALVRNGHMTILASQEDIEYAVAHPPEDSRAWLRGTLVEQFAGSVAAASWQNIVVESETHTVRIPLGAIDMPITSALKDSVKAATTTQELADALHKHNYPVEIGPR